MKINSKRGFTIVELIIVIAVIAILAAVLIPTFSNLINQANEAVDESLVRNLNESLAMDGTSKHLTMSQALAATKAQGFDVSKINAKASNQGEKNEILWDSENDCFVYLKGETLKYIPDSEKTPINGRDWLLWKIYASVSEIPSTQKYSVYLADNNTNTLPELSVGVDLGENRNVKAVNYVNNGAAKTNVVIRTNNFATKVTVNAPKDTVTHYGYAWLVDIQSVDANSYNEAGVVGRLKVTIGHVVVENTAAVMTLINTSNTEATVKGGATVTNTATANVVDCGKGNHTPPRYVNDGVNEYEVCTKCGYALIKLIESGTTYVTSSDGSSVTDDRDNYVPAVKTTVFASTKEKLNNSNFTLDDIPLVDSSSSGETQKHVPVEITMGNVAAEEIAYSETNTGYTGKGVMLGSTNLNKYAAAPAGAGEYTFIFKDGTITSAATGYDSIDRLSNTSVYMLVPGNSDVVFENMTFNGVVSFDIQMYTSPWSYLNSITFKNCTFNGIVVGSCPANKATFDGCTFNNYTNTTYANNSNPIWWRAATGYWGDGADESVHSLEEFVFVNNTVTSTRPVKIERIGWNCVAKITIKNNSFDISKQAGDTETKNMAINIGQKDNTSKFVLIDDGNTISTNTASLYTAALGSGSNQYIVVAGSKVLDGNGNEKTITAMVWKTTTGETFEMKSIN